MPRQGNIGKVPDERSLFPPRQGKRSPRDLDREASGLAERQHGVVSRRQLLTIGLGAGAIEVRMQRGLLHPIHRGVYAFGLPQLSLRGRWLAAVLASGKRAALSHRSAGELWRILRPQGVAIEATRPTGWRGPEGVVLHRGDVPDDEMAVVEGISVTSVPRTILDLAAVLPVQRLERVLNEAEVRRLADRLSIPDLLERHPRRRGSAALRRLLDYGPMAPGVTESHLEDRFLRLLHAHDLPRPRLNMDLALRGRFFRPDCAWPEQRLIVELDGRAAHGTDRAFEKDRERDRILLGDGWRVIRVTWRQLRDRPVEVVEDLRGALLHSPPTL